jgi:YesN/AraC family two-component response regulator
MTVFTAEERSGGPLACLLTESLLHACLSLLKKPAKAHSGKAVRTYESICLYVQENFQGHLTRENIAKHFGLAPSHVSRLFRQEGQVQFHDYLNLVRMNRAKFMLRSYTVTLKEIAANCGYDDIAYFCRVFKQLNHETPTQYRTKENNNPTRQAS